MVFTPSPPDPQSRSTTASSRSSRIPEVPTAFQASIAEAAASCQVPPPTGKSRPFSFSSSRKRSVRSSGPHFGADSGPTTR